MDLVSFISGVGPTQSFSPGISTDPALAGPHTGLTDGTSPTTASSNMAEIYNRLLLQVASVIVKSGLPIDNSNWSQLADAVAALSSAQISGSLAENGYIHLGNELIVQWGHVGSWVTANFPIAFPTAVYTVVAVKNAGTGAIGEFGVTYTNSSVTPGTNANVSPYNWLAIGH